MKKAKFLWGYSIARVKLFVNPDRFFSIRFKTFHLTKSGKNGYREHDCDLDLSQALLLKHELDIAIEAHKLYELSYHPKK